MTPLYRAAWALARHLQGGGVFTSMPKDKTELREWFRQGKCSCNDATQEDVILAAREFLLGIREPSDGMIEATNGISYNDNGEFNALWIWQAMIDAALNEGLET